MAEYLTKQGQALYIPMGWRHFATPAAGGASKDGGGDPATEQGQGEAEQGRSVHVTMGVQLPRWGDLIEGAFALVLILPPAAASAASGGGGGGATASCAVVCLSVCLSV